MKLLHFNSPTKNLVLFSFGNGFHLLAGIADLRRELLYGVSQFQD